MSYNQMTPYRVTNDGQNLPVSWIKKETLAEAGAGDWLVFPQEAGCVEVTIDATAGCGYIQYTPDVESVLADETPGGITTWEQGEVASAIKSVFMFAGGAIRLVNQLGSVTMIVLAKKQGGSLAATALGVPTDAPATVDTAEDATARSMIALLKHMVNADLANYTALTTSKRAEVINGVETIRTGAQTIGAQQTFTAAYVDWGAEIPVAGYNKLMLLIDKIRGGADTGLKLQILGKHTGAGAAEYVLETDIALGDATGSIAISRPALLNNCIEYIQLQIKDDAGGTSTVEASSRYELAW